MRLAQREQVLVGLLALCSVFVVDHLAGPLSAQANHTINATEAAQNVGTYTTVCGAVGSTKFLSSSRGKPTFLNMGGVYPDHAFTVVIFGTARPRWDSEPENLYLNQKICVTGEIAEYRGDPQIIVNWPKEIRLDNGRSEPENKQSQGRGALRVELLSPLKWDRPSTTCRTTACVSLLKLINEAQVEISFAAYGLRGQPVILEALRKAKVRGISIRGVIDQRLDGTSYYSDTEDLETVALIRSDIEADRRRALVTMPDREEQCSRPVGFAGPLQCLWYDLGDRCLVAAHASREPFGSEGNIMHDKFFVTDNRYVWTGSANLSDTGTGGYNANAVVVIDSEELAGWYLSEFREMYETGRFHREKENLKNTSRETVMANGDRVKVLFSPQGNAMQREIEPLIRSARVAIDIPMFFLTHKFLTQRLIDAHLRGVRVRVIIDATAAGNGYTKHELLRAVGIPVKVENWGGKMHMKVAVIDGRYSVLGSMNWTAAGEKDNDENILIVESDAIASQISHFFDQLWESIPDRWLTGRPDPESMDSVGSCSDGIDNDFDDLIDRSDPSCASTAALPTLPPYRFVEIPASGKCRDLRR